MTDKRNCGVELFRCLLMFGIVLLHVIDQGGYCRRGYWDLLRPCVVGFVFISGYYGIRSSLRKILALVGVGVWCAMLSVGIRYCRMGAMPIGSYACDVAYALSHGYWFLWAYLVLMVFAPLVNSAAEKRRWRELCLVVFVVFCWSYLAVVPGIKEWIPAPIGFGPLSPLTLTGIYTAAVLYREFELERFVTGWAWMGAAIICAVGCWCGFGHYNSPVALALMSILFCFLKRIYLPK